MELETKDAKLIMLKRQKQNLNNRATEQADQADEIDELKGQIEVLQAVIENKAEEIKKLKKNMKDKIITTEMEKYENQRGLELKMKKLENKSRDMAVRLQGATEQIMAERSKNQALEQRTMVDQEQVTVLKKELVKLQQTLKTKGGDDQEKDDMITDLRSESEALAKQNGKLSETIRKLRAKEKNHDSEVTKQIQELKKDIKDKMTMIELYRERDDENLQQLLDVSEREEHVKGREMKMQKLEEKSVKNSRTIKNLRDELKRGYTKIRKLCLELEDQDRKAANNFRNKNRRFNFRKF